MTVSPANRAMALVVALATPVALAPAWAQDSLPTPETPDLLQSPAAISEPVELAPPTTLLPPEGEAGEAPDLPASSSGGSGSAPTELTLPGLTVPETGGTILSDPDPTPEIEGIEISRLSELDPESVGVLDPGQGGFPGHLWQGTERRTVERLLPRLPGALGSATLRDLARRLLLSNAAPPAGDDESGASERGMNLLALRVGRLAAMGDFEGLGRLLEVVPQRYDNEAVARARVETLFLDGRGSDACKEVRIRVSELGGGLYWRKALVYCQLLQDDQAGANLGLALLREQGAAEADPVFFALAEGLAGLGDPDPTVRPATALHLAMFQSTGLPLPADMADQASPGLLVVLARTPANSLPQRIQAAEQALALGLLAPKELAALYQEQPFEAAQRANAISASESLAGAERRALFYQAALAQGVPAARAELLSVALRAAREDGSYGLMARVLEPLVGEIPVQPELAWFAETAGRVLYAAGRFEQAAAWSRLAGQGVSLESDTAAAALWPYSRLAGAQAAGSAGGRTTLSSWAEAQPGLTPEVLAERQVLLRTVFQALGQPESPASLVWSDLVGSPALDPEALGPEAGLPDAALIYALSEASQRGRLGETVLLSLLALGEAGPGGAHPLVLHEVLAALGRVDLAYEARLLAIEAAVAKGI